MKKIKVSIGSEFMSSISNPFIAVLSTLGSFFGTVLCISTFNVPFELIIPIFFGLPILLFFLLSKLFSFINSFKNPNPFKIQGIPETPYEFDKLYENIYNIGFEQIENYKKQILNLIQKRKYILPTLILAIIIFSLIFKFYPFNQFSMVILLWRICYSVCINSRKYC